MSQANSQAYEHDLLARQPFSQELERFLLTEHQFVEGSLVVSLNAPFGSGKTTFLRMWADDLTARRANAPDLPRPVTINAWESDYCGDPLLALVSVLSRALADTTAPSPEPGKAESIREAAKDLLWFGVGLANSFVSQATGIDAVAAGEVATAKKEERQALQASELDALKVFEGRTAALSKLKSALSAAFGADQPKAIVLIDELDRCRPDYAISYLETIKHIFDVHGIVFVLAVDEGQLRSAAEVLFGSSLVFAEYYRKFSHRTVSLPEPGKEDVSRLVRNYCDRYLQTESGRHCILTIQSEIVENIVFLFHGFHLRPRQIQEAFRVMGHTLSTSPEKKLRVNWCFINATLFMAGLRTIDQGAYEELAKGTMPMVRLGELVSSLGADPSNQEWWFQVLAAGVWNAHSWENEVLNEMSKRGWVKVAAEKKPDLRGLFADFFQGWGGVGSQSNKPGLSRVHERIERLMHFAN
jgi:hypothetical protein